MSQRPHSQFQGIGLGAGVAIGKTLFYRSAPPLVTNRLSSGSVESEWARVAAALDQSRSQLQDVKSVVLARSGNAQAAIIDAHLMILEDPEILDGIRARLQSDKASAEYAVQEVFKSYETVFAGMEDPYLRERAADVRDLGTRVLRRLLNVESADLNAISVPCVLVADDLPPSVSAVLNPEKVLGIVSEVGGATSHMAILARSLGIPAVSGIEGILARLSQGDMIALNGETGMVEVNAPAEVLQRYLALQSEHKSKALALRQWVGKKTLTADGTEIALFSNIGSLKDAETALKNDAEGVGLFRTEFLFMERSEPPTEEEQFEVYRSVLAAMKGKKTVIRTLDVGGDKKIPFIHIEEEANPFLGVRAIRHCLKDRDLFKTQLRALLRASVAGELSIMIPMITNVSEVLETWAVVEECKLELKTKSVRVSESLELGIMIEVPSAAILSDQLAKHCDFFSVGTNDLIQYTCAVDRMNSKVDYLYDPYSPAVLRLLRQIVNHGTPAIPVSVCGEMGGTKELIPLLIGLGFRQLSMNSKKILANREWISSLRLSDCEALAQKALQSATSADVKRLL